ncbi:MAG: PIN domain-containing protein [Pirellulales bacterium]|nr:PIN domain-containing protein [Pirellulales bacterium]
MNGSTIPLICWDSCICLAWFQNETDKALDMIQTMLDKISKGELNLLLSAVSFAEVIDRAKDSKPGTEFEGFVKRPNVTVANVDERVGRIARIIREDALQAHDAGKLKQGVKIPDALITATAVLYKATELHTYDSVLREYGELNPPILRGLLIGRPEDIPAGPLFSPE